LREWSVFTEYGYRWEIESDTGRLSGSWLRRRRRISGFASSTSRLRLLYSIWRAVDLLVQVELTGEYEHSPIVTADNTLTLLKKETGIG